MITDEFANVTEEFEIVEPSTNGDKPKSGRQGNPLMRGLTDDHLTNDQDFAYEKLDALFKRCSDELITRALFNGYLSWRKDADKREKVAKVKALQKKMEELGLSPDDLK